MIYNVIIPVGKYLLIATQFKTKHKLKSYSVGWGGGGGGPCDYSVSPSPFGLDFGTLHFGLLTRAGQKYLFHLYRAPILCL